MGLTRIRLTQFFQLIPIGETCKVGIFLEYIAQL